MSDEKPEGYRGTGILVTRGDFRLRNLSLSLTTGSSATAEVRTDTFDQWLHIAGEARDRAQAARSVALAADDGEPFANAIEAEFRPSMVAVAASAFAVDAFYASVVHHAPEARVKCKSRTGTLLETLKLAFRLNGEQQKTIHVALRQVFGFRRQAVHPPASFVLPVAHPVFGLGMEPRLVIFRVENAASAQRFAHEVIWLCLHKPKPKWVELSAWCEQAKNLVDEPKPPRPP